jgi:hypothetical protein
MSGKGRGAIGATEGGPGDVSGNVRAASTAEGDSSARDGSGSVTGGRMTSADGRADSLGDSGDGRMATIRPRGSRKVGGWPG